jgi:ribonuclease HI
VRYPTEYRKVQLTKVEPHVNIYTDGSCLRNPGPGGYGLILEYEGKKTEKSGGFRKTTNNRMEITAAIVALESLKTKCRVTVYTDSEYLVKSMTLGWAKKWRANNWVKADKKNALNPDLWEKLLKLCEKHEVGFVWVRGHNNQRENERCDTLANESAKKPGLPADEVYERIK